MKLKIILMFPVFFFSYKCFFSITTIVFTVFKLSFVIHLSLTTSNLLIPFSRKKKFFLYKIVPLMFTDTKGDFSVEFMLCSCSRKFSFFLYNFMQSTWWNEFSFSCFIFLQIFCFQSLSNFPHSRSKEDILLLLRRWKYKDIFTCKF